MIAMKENKNNTMLKGNKLSSLYHENTKIFFVDENEDIRYFSDLFEKIHFKTYPRFENVELPHNLHDVDLNIESAIENRRSVREFNEKICLSLEEVSKLLLYSSGILFNETNNWDKSRRAYPSAGARYPLETYLISLNIEGLEPGIYHYNVKSHSLELIRVGVFAEEVVSLSCNQTWIEKSSMVLITSAIFPRNQIKYDERGYRYIFLEAGHLMQNIYLMASALKLGCCSIGGFLDDEINNLLDIDGINESAIYLNAIGKIKL